MSEKTNVEQLAEYATENPGIQRVFSEIFKKSMEDPELKREMEEFQRIASRETLKQSIPVHMVSYEIQPQYAKQLNDICEKKGIGLLNMEIQTTEGLTKNQAWICDSQEKEFAKAVLEARIRSGYDWEVPRDYVQDLIPEFRKDNPMKECKDLTVEEYLKLRENVQKLEPDMRFTLIPKYHIDDGKTMVDVGFLSKTEQKYDKEGEVFDAPKSYQIPEMVKGLILNEQMKAKDPMYEVELSELRERETFRKNTVESLMKNDAVTPNVLKEAIEKTRIPVSEKQELLKYLEENNKTEFKNKVNALEIPDSTKDYLKRGIDRLGKEQYLVLAKKEKGDWVMDDREILCVGRDLTIQGKGKDSVISDKTIAKLQMERFCEKASGPNQTFVVLSAEEFQRLREEKEKKKTASLQDIPFLKGQKLTGTYETVRQDTIIDMINEKREQFIVSSDNPNLSRVEDRPQSIIQNLITEHDEIEVQKDIQEEIEVSQAIEDFDHYIKNEIDSVDEVSESIKNPDIDKDLDDLDNLLL